MTMSNISSPPSVEQEPVTSTGFDYNSWRERFLLILLRISFFLGIGVTVFSFIQSSQPRDLIIFSSLLVILFGVTFFSTNYNLRAYTLLFITFAIGINGILTLGTWTDASIYLLASIVLASLLFDSYVNLF